MLQLMNELTANDAKYGMVMATLGAFAVVAAAAIIVLVTMPQ